MFFGDNDVNFIARPYVLIYAVFENRDIIEKVKQTFLLENKFYNRTESSATKYHCIGSKITVFQKDFTFLR